MLCERRPGPGAAGGRPSLCQLPRPAAAHPQLRAQGDARPGLLRHLPGPVRGALPWAFVFGGTWLSTQPAACAAMHPAALITGRTSFLANPPCAGASGGWGCAQHASRSSTAGPWLPTPRSRPEWLAEPRVSAASAGRSGFWAAGCCRPARSGGLPPRGATSMGWPRRCWTMPGRRRKVAPGAPPQARRALLQAASPPRAVAPLPRRGSRPGP